MRRSVAVAIVIVIVMVPWVDHDGCAVVPMPVSHTDANSNVADADFDGFSDDHWFVADVQRTGNCRHRQD
jgi:hypothetical protein